MIGLALGVPRMGKTQALLDYVGSHALTNRFFVVDRAGDWVCATKEGEEDRWRGIRWKEWNPRLGMLTQRILPGAQPVATDRPWFGEAPPPDQDLASWARGLPASGVFRFGWPWEGPEVAQLAKDVGDVTYVDDELDLVALHESWKTNPLRDFCHRGRHLPNLQGKVGEVHLLGAARRPQSLHIDVTSLADWVMVFRVQGHRTLQRLLDDRILDPGEEETARQLEPYHFKLWEASGVPSWGRLAPL